LFAEATKRSETSEPTGVRAFNFLTVWLLDKLYQSFPSPVSLDLAKEAIGMAIEHFGIPDAEPKDMTQLAYMRDTVRWLNKEGFIRWSGVTLDDHIFSVELTAKAFAILQKTPAAIANKGEAPKPFGQLLREAMVQKSAESLATVAQLLLTTATLGTAAG
jgi:hypothetical protein